MDIKTAKSPIKHNTDSSCAILSQTTTQYEGEGCWRGAYCGHWVLLIGSSAVGGSHLFLATCAPLTWR